MPLDDVANITISADSRSPTRPSFGAELILSASPSATWVTNELVRGYSSAKQILADFAATTPEYKAGLAAFSQRPSLRRVFIGRLQAKPTMQLDYTVVTPVIGKKYTFLLNGVEITHTAVAADNDTIVAALVAAVTAAAIPEVNSVAANGSVGAQKVRVIGNEGAWLYTELASAAGELKGPEGENLLHVASTGAAPSVITLADQLTDLLEESPDWYVVTNPYYSKAICQDISAWIEGEKRLYFQETVDSEIVTVAEAGASDIAKTLKDLARFRTGLIYHHKPVQLIAAAWMGRFLSKDPGRISAAYKEISGATPTQLKSTHFTNLKAKNCNWYENLGGRGSTREGKMVANEWADKMRDLDWWEANTKLDVVGTFQTNDKIDYDDAGIAVVRNKIEARNTNAVSARVFAEDPAPETIVPKAADVLEEDRQNRHLPGVVVNARVRGAIHTIDVEANITV